MSSFPLSIWKTFRGEQGEVANAEEYQPLANDPNSPDPPEPAQMGVDEQTPKLETRRGDLPAEWAAYVRFRPTISPRTILICPRYLLQCVSLSGISLGRLTVDPGLNQIFLTTTWLIALNSSPSTPFTYHPILQSLGVSCFAWGEIRPKFLFLTRRLNPNTQGS